MGDGPAPGHQGCENSRIRFLYTGFREFPPRRPGSSSSSILFPSTLASRLSFSTAWPSWRTATSLRRSATSTRTSATPLSRSRSAVTNQAKALQRSQAHGDTPGSGNTGKQPVTRPLFRFPPLVLKLGYRPGQKLRQRVRSASFLPLLMRHRHAALPSVPLVPQTAAECQHPARPGLPSSSSVPGRPLARPSQAGMHKVRRMRTMRVFRISRTFRHRRAAISAPLAQSPESAPPGPGPGSPDSRAGTLIQKTRNRVFRGL